MQVAWRRIISDINRTAQSYLLCASGGVDSMFMLDFFLRNCRPSFRVAHFNHGLRMTPDRDETLVSDWCARNAISFIRRAGDPDAMRCAPSLEAEARAQRYAFFEDVLAPGELIVTAHHANDQVETVLMRLMRGVPEGGLRMRTLDGRRFRPFLAVPKGEIVRQAKNRRLEWVEDETNADLSYERNWVRHVLVPQMMERRNILKTIGLQKTETESEAAPDGCPGPRLNC